MSAGYKGGAAFPRASAREDFAGMDLRDYFAAHAPKAPDWYKHEPSEPFPFAPKDGEEESEQAKRQRAAWIARQRMEKFIRWRWFYADMMMAARNE